jgi:hypothetical protein
MSMKNSSDTIGNRSPDLPVSSAVPQPLRHRVPPNYTWHYIFISENFLYVTICCASDGKTAVYGTPDDGHGKYPKNVELSCNEKKVLVLHLFGIFIRM